MTSYPSADAIDAAVKRAKQQLVDRFFARPNDFYTEGDVAAFLAHRLHTELDEIEVHQSIVHLQYPTPFRCSMATGTFVRSDDANHRRGFYDVSVLNPAYLKEVEEDYRLAKGQTWSILEPQLEKREASSELVALVVFELMFNRDPFWSDQAREKGAATMRKFASC